MKALLLSGGRGGQLRPFSYSMAEQLIPIANKPVLQYALENIREIGVTEIGVVVGDHAGEITAAIGDGARLGAQVTYIRSDEPLGITPCIAAARPFLGSDDFVVYRGDNMLPAGIKACAAQFAAGRPAAQLLVHQELPDPGPSGAVPLGREGRVPGLADKPARPRSHLAIVGVYFFTSAIHAALPAAAGGTGGEPEITGAVQRLLAAGAKVTACEYRDYWKDTAVPEDVLDCNRRVLGGLRAHISGRIDAATELYGPVVVELGAQVRRSRIIGPAVVGARTVIEDSCIGPDTSIGRSCVLRETELSDSIVLDGASIAEVPGLRNCIIGRSATVSTGDYQQDHDRLVVGDHARIKLADRQPGPGPAAAPPRLRLVP